MTAPWKVAVQQILYTAQPATWWKLAELLGFVAPFPPEPAWGEFHADGVLAVHGATDEHRPGMTDIHLLVEELDAAASALSGFNVDAVTMEGVGEMLVVRAASGISISVSEREVREGAAPRGTGGIAVQPIWFQEDLAEPRIGLSFEARGDLDALTARLRDAAFAASIVDEAFVRTIRVPDPDGGDEVWINGVQDDLHGYHR